MPRDPRHDILFEPVRIGPKTMRNRFYKTPHCSSFGSDWPGTQAHFRAMAAEGGWAAISTEYCSIHPSSDGNPSVSARLWDDTDVRNLGLMCERIHEHGSLAGVQLWYGAAHARNYESRVPAAGASQIPSDYLFVQSCYELDLRGIRDLQCQYVAAAKRARSAGFDIVNVYGGHGYPITWQFLDPFYNRRTDGYGGSFRNRARFWLETIEQVKEAVGDDCAIAVRICIASLREGALSEEESHRFIEAADHLVDLWDFQIGGSLAEWGEDTLSSRFGAENYERSWLERAHPHTARPTVGVGRFTSPDTMAEMVRSGVIDCVGSARGSIADPFLPRKIETGRLDDVRECIGNNVCAARYMQRGLLICTQNATAGEEYRRGWHPEKFTPATNSDLDVLVVGAGPAGMECALVLGKRGMRRVHLVDAEEDIGGVMRWVPRLPGLGEWGRIVNYRRIQLEKLRNVELVLGTRLDAGAVLAYGADLVVVATGARWAGDGLSGTTHAPIPGADASLPHVLTPEQIMVEGKSVPGERVLVYDTDGYYMGVGLAELLAREGREVTLLTPFGIVSPFSTFTLEAPRLNRQLHAMGVDLLSEHVVERIERGRVHGCHVYATDRPLSWEVDAVVLATQRISSVALYRTLSEGRDELAGEGIRGLYRIGDCVAPRLVADAIFDGHRLAREIDSDDPETPLPFIRENRVLGATDADYDGTLRTRPSGDYVPSSMLGLRG